MDTRYITICAVGADTWGCFGDVSGGAVAVQSDAVDTLLARDFEMGTVIPHGPVRLFALFSGTRIDAAKLEASLSQASKVSVQRSQHLEGLPGVYQDSVVFSVGPSPSKSQPSLGADTQNQEIK